VKNHPVLVGNLAGGIESMQTGSQEPIDITPRYSNNEVPGRCIKCLAEEKLFSCMRELLKEEKDNQELQQKYKILYSFLESPELQALCDETERYLAEGKEVSVKLTLEAGKLKYEIILNDETQSNNTKLP
jgi:hypothetical protein